MLNKNCNSMLTGITISIIISFIYTLLFFNGLITNIFPVFIFSLILSLISLLILSILGTSDNGLTRNSLCQNYLNLIISITGNILANLTALITTLSSGNILSAIIVSLAFFFLLLNIFSLIALIVSVLNYNWF